MLVRTRRTAAGARRPRRSRSRRWSRRACSATCSTSKRFPAVLVGFHVFGAVHGVRGGATTRARGARAHRRRADCPVPARIGEHRLGPDGSSVVPPRCTTRRAICVEPAGVPGSGDAGAPRRRHLRALPAVPRAAARVIATPTASRSARRAWSSARCFAMLEGGATHLGVATDHVDRVVPQRPLGRLQDGRGHRSRAVRAVPAARGRPGGARASRCGRWSTSKPTTRSRARRAVAADDPRVEQVIICTPDKDLGQCVGGKVVQLDRPQGDPPRRRRRAREVRRARRSRFPTGSRSSATRADGFPGLPGFGAKTAAAVLDALRPHRGDPRRRARVGRPGRARRRPPGGDARRGPRRRRPCSRMLATLRTDADVGTVDDWDWTGPDPSFADWCERLGRAETARTRAEALAQDERIAVSRAPCSSRPCGPGITQLTLNRPERLNAMNYALDLRSLRRARRAAPTDRDLSRDRAHRRGSRVLRRASTSPRAHRRRRRPALGRAQAGMTVQKMIAGLVPKMRSMPQPIIAAVNGAASGGGLALALASDVRIAAASARFNVAFVRVGLSGCDIGVSWMLPAPHRRVARVRVAADRPAHRRGRSRSHRARHAGRRPTARSSSPRSRPPSSSSATARSACG